MLVFWINKKIKGEFLLSSLVYVVSCDENDTLFCSSFDHMMR